MADVVGLPSTDGRFAEIENLFWDWYRISSACIDKTVPVEAPIAEIAKLNAEAHIRADKLGIHFPLKNYHVRMERPDETKG